MATEAPMRVLIDGNVHDPLTSAQEKDVRQFSAEESVQGSVLSADEATTARVGQTRRVLVIFWGLIAVAAAGIASLAEPADLPVVLDGGGRRRRCPGRLLRLHGPATHAELAAGSAAAPGGNGAGRYRDWRHGRRSCSRRAYFPLVDAGHRAGRAGQNQQSLPHDVHPRAPHARGPGGVVVLDPALMRNGHRIIGNAWRRMRLAGSGVTV